MLARSWRAVYLNRISIPFWIVHLLPFALVPLAGISWAGVLLSLGVYVFGMFFVTAGYHRYFSHRSFKTSRWFQFVLAWGAQITCQKGVLWWSANHRHHHKHSDLPTDTHSAKLHGFWWSHVGWFLSNEFRTTDLKTVSDMAKYKEILWLNHPVWNFLPPITYAVIMYLTLGVWGLAYGCFLPLVFVFHGTFTINSLAHLIGRRRYKTTDESKNNLFLALITLGEGWHNNHHHYQSSCRQGFKFYEVDFTYYVLWVLSKLGLVWDLKTPPRHVVEDRPKDQTIALRTRKKAA